MHIHLAADNRENAFLVALRTPLRDSTGVAHILEHTVLCGSERYPVRDPFFFMLRRSLNSYMNAFTTGDCTAYPFASPNATDFCNLMDVYLDAVFFPRLDRRDFGQEGHRLEFAEPDNPDSPLIRCGVVFNEMKGALSSPVSFIHEAMKSCLYPASTYHFNSGGEPEQIPDLSYEELLDFHLTHYHPGNAIFMTYGNLPSRSHQEKFEQQVLSRFKGGLKPVHLHPERRYFAPVRVEQFYPAAVDAHQTASTHVLLGWLLGPGADPEQLLEARLLAELLLANSASPLRKVLETSRLTSAISPLCGLETESFEINLVVGVETHDPEQADAIEQLILSTLQDVAKTGIDSEQVEAVLHQLELEHREPGGDTCPFGLQLMFEVLPAAVHHGNPIGLLNMDASLALIRKQAAQPTYISGLIHRMLLDNSHRVRLVMKPDSDFEVRRKDVEFSRLRALQAGLDEAGRQQIRNFAAQVKRRQEEEEDLSCLPKVAIEDVSAEVSIPVGHNHPLSCGDRCTEYACATGGLVYLETLFKLPPPGERLEERLPVLNLLIGRLGTHNRSYLATQREQQRFTGDLQAFTEVRATPDNNCRTQGFFVVHGKSLADRAEQLIRLMNEAIVQVSFGERQRIAELLQQSQAEGDAAITERGASLAVTAAASGLAPAIAMRHRLSGLEWLVSLRELCDSLQTVSGMDLLQEELRSLLALIRRSDRQHLVVADATRIDLVRTRLDSYWRKERTLSRFSVSQPVFSAENRQQLWVTLSRVNCCALAYPTVAEEHPDSAPLLVLAGVMTNGFLHKRIREQGGAYDAGAFQDPANGVFCFHSYHDPRFAGTYEDFSVAIARVQQQLPTTEQTEESILGLIAGIDAPGSPAGEARKAFHNELHGRHADQRKAFRRRLLQVTPEDLQRVASLYLCPEKASRGALVSESALPEANGLGVEFQVSRI